MHYMVRCEELAEAQQRQAEAKSKRDAKPGDSNAQTDHERAVEETRNAEKALEQFNAKYSKDIADFADKLIRQYRDEKDSHDRPLGEAKNRVDSCKKIDNTSY
jgi:hypothetical protein